MRIVLAVLSLSMAAAALAWACTPAANITLSESMGQPGTTVTVTGRQFAPSEPVQVYWGGAGAQVLARATTTSQGGFEARVTIPNAPADVHMITAAGAQGSNSASFTIEGAAPSREEDSSAPAPARRPGTSTQAPQEPGNASVTTRGAEAGTTTAARAVTGGGARAAGGGKAVEEGVAKLPSGTSVFADSVPARARAASGTVSRSTGTSRSKGRVRAASATGDLWSGFASEKAGTGLGSAPAPAPEGGSVPLLSLALTGLGLLTVLAGAAAAGLRRRRSHARPGGGPSAL